jgi:hypothetical protein
VRVSLNRGFRVVVLVLVVCSSVAVVVVVAVVLPVLVSVVVVVVSGLTGTPMSVVDTDTLVGKELEVVVGVITNGVRPDGGGCDVGTPTVVGAGGGGLLQSSANRSTDSVRPASTAAAPIPAAAVTQGGRSDVSSAATEADPSRVGRMLVLR